MLYSRFKLYEVFVVVVACCNVMIDNDVQVVSARFPSLSKHAAKLVEIYCALCLDGVTNGDGNSVNDGDDDSASVDVLRKYLRHIGRPISTRYDIQHWFYFTMFMSYLK